METRIAEALEEKLSLRGGVFQMADHLHDLVGVFGVVALHADPDLVGRWARPVRQEPERGAWLVGSGVADGRW